MSSFERWELQARLALGERGIGHGEATPLIEDARRHHAESGASPWAALGRPADFAAEVAADRPAAQARVDLHGKTARDYVTDALFFVAASTIPATVIAAVMAGSLSFPVTVAGLAGVVLLMITVLAFASPPALRAGGHPRLAPWGFVLAGALAVAATFALSSLPKTRIGDLPALVPLVAAAGLCWLLTRPAPAPSSTPSSAPEAVESGSDPVDAEAWFGRLDALLVGRFDVPPARAAALVAETRSHVAAAGSHPHDEFPSLAVYARELAAAEPVRQGPWWRGATASRAAEVALPLLVLVYVADAARDSRWWATLGGSVVVLATAHSAWAGFRGRPGRQVGRSGGGPWG